MTAPPPDLDRIREVYPFDRRPCAWCGVRSPRQQHHYDCPVPDVHALLAHVEELQASAAQRLKALTALNRTLTQVDNGTCGICRIGFRTCDTRGRALANCSNDKCPSHQVARALTTRREPRWKSETT